MRTKRLNRCKVQEHFLSAGLKSFISNDNIDTNSGNHTILEAKIIPSISLPFIFTSFGNEHLLSDSRLVHILSSSTYVQSHMGCVQKCKLLAIVLPRTLFLLALVTSYMDPWQNVRYHFTLLSAAQTDLQGSMAKRSLPLCTTERSPGIHGKTFATTLHY